MKKISTMMMALLAAVTMSATVVTMDFTSSTELAAMGATVPETGKSWNLTGNSMVKGGVTLTGDKGTASTDNRIYNSNGTLSFRTYKNGTITFTVTGSDLIKGLIFDGTAFFTGVELNKIATNAATVTLTCTANSTIKSVKVYVNEDLPSTTVDTVSVSEALARIDKGEKQACYIKGVVASAPFLSSSKYYTVWLTDINNPSDSIQAYTMRKGKATTEVYTSLDEMAKDFGMLDTVLIMAEALNFYAKTSVYETKSGYYVETLGKSSAINANTIFPYAVGALQCGKAYDGVRYKYELVLSKVGEQEPENALHLVLNSSLEKGIAGTYTIRNYQTDSSYVDGEGPVDGTATVTYVSVPEGKPAYNTYNVVADLKWSGKVYRMDTTYNIEGWTAGYGEEFALTDDRPYIPQEGDTITCAQALSYAKSLGTSTGVKVYVKGFVNGVDKNVKGRTQQSLYMADTKSAKEDPFVAYICYTQNLDSIIIGDEVIVKGNVKYYSSKSKAEIEKGDIYRIGGSDTKRPRNPQLEARPADAITVAQALIEGNKLEEGASTTTEFIVAGYIVDVNRQTGRNANDTASWYMADEKGAYGEFKADVCEMKSLICEDDEVFVTGKISKKNGAISIHNGRGGFINAVSAVKEIVAAMPQDTTQKIFVNGKIYIVRSGVAYDLQGNVIK